MEAQPPDNHPIETGQLFVGRVGNKRDKWLVSLFVILAAALLVWGAWEVHSAKSSIVKPIQTSSRRDSQAGDINAKTNQTVSIANLKLTVTKLTFKTVSSETEDPAGTVTDYYVADITLENPSSKTPVGYSANQFSLLTDKGSTAALETFSPQLGVDKPLGAGSITQGAKIDGQVAFVRPTAATYQYVVFIPKAGARHRAVIGD